MAQTVEQKKAAEAKAAKKAAADKVKADKKAAADKAKAEKKADAEKAKAEKPAKKAAVNVVVLCASLGEGGETYAKGEEFVTTEGRAAALGDAVKMVNG